MMIIAPCGMNCALCQRYLRDKNGCLGCTFGDTNMPRYCAVCRIRNCPEIRVGEKRFCFECARFPCTRLRQLDKRYRTKYSMSMIENLESIRALGMEEFVTREKDRWKCPQCGELINVHSQTCMHCGRLRGN